ncbi:MAG: hypothetical protein IPK31_16725 [Chitinophagaceae bacterium]|nr:hypothetical protein [Chitinophagaceae bacterium]
MNPVYKLRLSISILFFIALFIVTWPLYQYHFDVDGIGYAAVAHHYLEGNFKLAVNGFWNPLHSWLAVPFMKAGLPDWAAFKVSNAIFSIGSLVVLYSLLNKFSLSDWLKTSIQLSSVILLLYYTYSELAADALLVFLLLAYFNLIKSGSFFSSIQKNLLAGFIGACLYFDKSYGFPFFIFHFIVIHLFLNPDKKQAVKQLAAGFGIFALFTFPWIYALHWKYGEWMIAFGKFNAHWDFSKGPMPGPVIQPPPYEGSAAVWEDPWHVRKNNLSNVPFLQIALHQVRVILFNFQQWLISIHELSFLASAILLMSAVNYFIQKNKTWLFLIITLITLPAGYILLHVETRFIWALSFVFMIAGGILMQQLFAAININKWQRLFIWLIFFGSFLLEPINKLKDQAFKHKEFFDTVDMMKQNSIAGKFISNTKKSECMVVAYLSKSSYYTIAKPSYTTDELLEELDHYQIRYYFFYYSSLQEKEEFLSGKIAAKAKQIREPETGLLVLDLY